MTQNTNVIAKLLLHYLGLCEGVIAWKSCALKELQIEWLVPRASEQ